MQFGTGRKFLLWVLNVAFVTTDFKKVVTVYLTLVPLWWKEMYQDEDIEIALKHNSSLKIVPYALQKYLVMHQSDSTCKYPVKSPNFHCKHVPKEVKQDE